MNASELRRLPVNELQAKRSDLKEECLRLRCGNVTRQFTDVTMIKKTRREIARINTVLAEIQKQQKRVEG